MALVVGAVVLVVLLTTVPASTTVTTKISIGITNAKTTNALVPMTLNVNWTSLAPRIVALSHRPPAQVCTAIPVPIEIRHFCVVFRRE